MLNKIIKRPIDSKEFVKRKYKLKRVTTEYEVALIGSPSYEKNIFLGINETRDGGAIVYCTSLLSSLNASALVIAGCRSCDIEPLLYPLRAKDIEIMHLNKDATMKQLYVYNGSTKKIHLNVSCRASEILAQDIPAKKVYNYIFVDEFIGDVNYNSIMKCSLEGNVGATSSLFINNILPNGEIEKRVNKDFYTIAKYLKYFVTTKEDAILISGVKDIESILLKMHNLGIEEVLIYDNDCMYFKNAQGIMYTEHIFTENKYCYDAHILSQILTAYSTSRITSQELDALQLTCAIIMLKLNTYGPFRYHIATINHVLTNFYYLNPTPESKNLITEDEK